MRIPYSEISKESLHGLIIQYITQEHGVNQVEDPVTTHYDAVYNSVVAGKLVVIYSRARCAAWLSPADPS